MRQRTSIVLASILKPVDDTRMFEKFGLSLGQTNKYDVNIIGFATKNLKKFDNIHFYPLFNFGRTSFSRLLAPLRLLLYLFKVKPSIVIFNTPEILYVIILYKLISGCRIIYDIQENYFRNVYYNKNYILPIRFLLAYAIRLKEWSGRWLIDRIILAEEGYKVEMPRSARRAVVIRNTYRDLDFAELDYGKFGNGKDLGEIKFNDQNIQAFHGNASTDDNGLNTRVSGGDRSNYDRRTDDEKSNGGGNTYNHGLDAGDSSKIGLNADNLNDPDINNHILDHKVSDNSRSNFRKQHKEGSVYQAPSQKGKKSQNTVATDIPESITFLFSGTISDNYGIFTAIDFIDVMHKLDPMYKLRIAGFCANEKILRELNKRIENKPYIKLIGGEYRVPHQEIIKHIRDADFGLVCYEINPSTENCFPTKIFEYMANQLPVIIQNYEPWASFCRKHRAGIEIDFHSFSPRNLSDSIKTGTYYTHGIPEEVFWKHDEGKLLKLVEDIQS